MYYYYYTLDEVCEGYVDPITHNGNSTEFEDVAANVVWHQSVPSWTQSNNNTDYQYLEECWLRVRSLFQRDNTYFWISVNEMENTEIYQEAQNRLYDFFNTFYTTKDQYIALIKAQTNLESDILKDIENVREDWFNDTPQASGTYTDTDHTTTYNKSKATTSLGAVSDKLDEVRRAKEDIYDRWVEHFKRFRIFN